MVPDQSQAIFLDEHFRSAPQIIAFSNRHFYDGALRLMTATPGPSAQRAVEIQQVSGRRNEAGVNPREAERVVEGVRALVAREEHLPKEICHGLGILSPFRAQADYLRDALAQGLPLAAWEKHDVLVGTPFMFQGEERDVVWISFALDGESPSASFRYLDREDVFNVAVTRARSRQILVTSLAASEARPSSLLRQYLEFAAAEPALPSPAGRRQRDVLLAEVARALEGRGLATWAPYDLAGLTLDLLVEREGAVLAIDLVGYPGTFGEALHLEHCRLLGRAGVPVFPLPISAWRRDPELCLEAIGRQLEAEIARREVVERRASGEPRQAGEGLP